jgi:hypothetical protein
VEHSSISADSGDAEFGDLPKDRREYKPQRNVEQEDERRRRRRRRRRGEGELTPHQ